MKMEHAMCLLHKIKKKTLFQFFLVKNVLVPEHGFGTTLVFISKNL